MTLADAIRGYLIACWAKAELIVEKMLRDDAIRRNPGCVVKAIAEEALANAYSERTRAETELREAIDRHGVTP
jgi:hypothetical protein